MAEALLRSGVDHRQKFMVVSEAVLDASRRWRPAGAREIAGCWRDFLSGGVPDGHLFQLYMHFPYCFAQCTYCYCVTENLGVRDRAARRSYVQDMLREARHFAPLFAGRAFYAWEVGGGSPTFLSAEDLRHWLGTVSRMFSFTEPGVRLIELDPAITTPEKLKVLKTLGFNYLSLGVQTFTPGVLRAVNRGHQSRDAVMRFFRSARAAGFAHFNADLLLGLEGETAGSFLESFRLLADLRPSTIAVHGLALTERYLRATGLEKSRFYSACDSLQAEVAPRLAGLAAQAGYRPLSFSRATGEWVFLAEGRSERFILDVAEKMRCLKAPVSELSLGWYGKSRIFSRAAYKRGSGPFDPGRAAYRLVETSTREEMANYILYSLARTSRLDFEELRSIFEGLDVRESFSGERAALRAAGKIAEEEDGLLFLPRGPSEANLWGLVFLRDFIKRSRFSPGTLEAVA